MINGSTQRRRTHGGAHWPLIAIFFAFMVYIIANTGGFGTEAVVLMSGFILLVASLRSQVRRG